MENNIISKEFLSEVLVDKIKLVILDTEILYNYYNDDIDAKIEKNKVFYFSKNTMDYEYINIHELAHKCKEWALTRGFWIESNIAANTLGYAYLGVFNHEEKETFKGKTEPEAIFKACQWILENK